MSGRPAVFLDRDGTIIRDTGYVSSPDQVELLPGAAAAIRRLNQGGVPVIVITNQSGIARGLLSASDYEAVHMRMVELLRAEGAHVDAAYFCPHAPDAAGQPTCSCRKPGVLLYRQAAAAHSLDLARSVFAGDKWSDVAPALVLGGSGVLLPGDATTGEDRQQALAQCRVAAALAEIADLMPGPE
jgi:D-glycero-D-manno-heptose 1,7-bisphosphate phosphatase